MAVALGKMDVLRLTIPLLATCWAVKGETIQGCMRQGLEVRPARTKSHSLVRGLVARRGTRGRLRDASGLLRLGATGKIDNFEKDLADVRKDELIGSGPRTYYRTLYRLNLRASEDVESEMIGLIPPGAKVSVREIKGRRALLETSGIEGWISIATESGDLNLKYLSGPNGSQEQLDALKADLEAKSKAEISKAVEKKPGEDMPLALQITLPFLAIAAAYGMVSVLTAGIVEKLFPIIYGK